MRKVLLALLLSFFSFVIFAQPPGFTVVGDLKAFRSVFAPAAQRTNSIQCDFVQEKNLSMLAEKITSRGKFWFRKNNLVRMEYTTPFQYLMVINNDKVFIKDGQKQNSISTKSNKLFQQINRITLDCVQGTVLDNRDFTVRVFESKTSYLLEMTPSARNLKEYFKTVNVFVDKKDFSVATIEMHEPGGDNTTIRFVNKVLNSSIPDALFTVK